MTAHPLPRRTLARTAVVAGTGLFTNADTTVRVHAGRGGLCLRAANANHALAPRLISDRAIHPAFEGTPPRSTNLAAKGQRFATVEHVLSALVGLGITDALIEVVGGAGVAEIPIGDGSAQPFVEAIGEAGFRDATDLTPVSPLTISEPVAVTGPDGATITAEPRDEPGCRYRYELDYGAGAPIPAQAAEVTLTPRQDSGYATDIAPARTFCLEAEARSLRAAGLFASLSPKDMLVIGANGPIDNAYRVDDEPARHKLLDLIGDLALVGKPLQLNITATKSGHALNHQLASALAGA